MVSRHALPGNSVGTPADDDPFNFLHNGHARKAPKLDYLLPGRVALGTLTVVEGRKGAGKSTFMAALAADVTGGPRLPGGRKKRVLGPVLWLTQEEDYALAVLPRIRAAGGDTKLILYPHVKDGQPRPRMVFPGHFTALEDIVGGQGVKLLVLDPWASFLDVCRNQNDEQQARDVLERFIDIGHRFACAIVFARHLRKNTYGPALDHGSGSVAIGAAARSVLLVGDFPGKPGWSAVRRVGGNIGPTPPALAWTLADAGNVARIVWQGEHSLDDEELATAQMDAGDQEENDMATQLLQDATKDGWCEVESIIKRGSPLAISARTLRRRKRQLSMSDRRRHPGGKQVTDWGPPKGGWPK